jgi:membrane carboxypeptidase/penicillin-binding protein
MVRAFSAFPNGGKGVDPIGILYVKDRTGKIIAEPEKERLARVNTPGGMPQLMQPETAYLMTNMLQTTVKSGTISGAANNYLNDVKYTFAGKTGTSQNWHDAWTIGFSPYFVTAVWFGFDQGGGSLGVNRTGATLAAPIWAKFNHSIHDQMDADRTQLKDTKQAIENLAQNAGRQISLEEVADELKMPSTWLTVIQQSRDFVRPGGLVDAEVCTLSGLRPSPYCPHDKIRNEIFYPDTVAEKECTYCPARWKWEQDQGNKIGDTINREIDIPPPENLIDPNSIPDNFDDFQKNKGQILRKVKPDDKTVKPKDGNEDKPINPYLD